MNNGSVPDKKLIGWECLSLRKPTLEMVRQVLEQALRAPFNHSIAGCTEDAPPLPEALQGGDWVLDHHRVQIQRRSESAGSLFDHPSFRAIMEAICKAFTILAVVGSGKVAYQDARRFIEGWRHMDLGWVCTSEPPIVIGRPLCITAQSLWIWNRFPLRVVYRKEGKAKMQSSAHSRDSITSSKPQKHLLTAGRRFTFATATLQGHQLQGEERFSVEWHKDDDSVWYEIYTVSRPATLLSKLTYPIVRAHQRKFARCSMKAITAALTPSLD